MEPDLPRLLTGVPVALLFPASIPQLRASGARVIVTASYAAAVVFPTSLSATEAWILVSTTTLAAFLLAPGGPVRPALSFPPRPLVLSLFVVCLGIGLTDFNTAKNSICDVLESDEVWIVLNGGLAAVFVGGLLVGTILTPFAAALENTPGESANLERAGTVIGWLERALIFSFVVAGVPEAAPLALAAKSFARFPSLSKGEEGFAEYFLIGSLGSIVLAVGTGMAVRSMLGMPVL